MIRRLLLSFWILFLLASVSAQLSAPQHYWKFNELNGTVLAVDSGSTPSNIQLNYSFANLDVGKLSNGLRLYSESGNIIANATNDISNAFGTGTFTVAFWFNSTTAGGGSFFIGTDYASSGWTISRNGANLEFLSGGVVRASITNALNSTWNRIVFARESTGANNTKIYVNNRNIQNITLADDITLSTGTFKIYTPNYGPYYMLDDLRVYKAYAWNVSDVSQDWNAGSGQELGSSGYVSSILLSPANASTVATTPIMYTAVVSPSGTATLTNATVYLYNRTSLVNKSSVTLTGTVATNAQFNMSLPFDIYFWNVYACATNSSGSGCASATSNYTMYVNQTTNNQTFTNPLSELTTDTISLNISIPLFYSVTNAVLYYNNTAYTSPSVTVEGNGKYIYSKSITSPTVPTTRNVTFYWNFTLSNGQTISTALTNQTIGNIDIGSCSVYPQLVVNYSVFDEDTFNPLTGQSANVTVQLYAELHSLIDDSLISTFNRTFSGVNVTAPAQLCAAAGVIDNSTSYSLDLVTAYSAYLHEPESYNVQNYIVNGSTVPYAISLYDLLTTNAQQFKLVYRDSNLLPVADVIIEVQRRYIGAGQFYSVEAPTTGVDGSTVASMVLNDEIYNFYVKRDGTVIDAFLNQRMFCSPSVSECVYNMDSLLAGGQLTSHQTEYGISYYNYYNSTIKIYSLQFSSLSGTSKNVTVIVTASNNSRLCAASSISSSATVLCVIDGIFETQTGKAEGYVDGQLLFREFFVIQKLDNATYGTTRILIAMMLLLCMATLFANNHALIIIGSVFAVFIAGAMFLLDTGTFGNAGVIIPLSIAGLLFVGWLRKRPAGN